MVRSSCAAPLAALTIGAGAIGAVGCTRADPVAALPRPPDIVLVSIDSLRFDHLGCYGYGRPTSPTIDRLAAEGVRCAVALSTTSWTLPAHAALFTGLFDSTHGVVDNGLRIAADQRTLPEILQTSGWETAGFFGGPYLDPSYGFGRGFAHYESCMTPSVTSSARDVTGPRTVEAVTRWMDEIAARPDRRPFFLFLHLWDVHYDYVPPPGYAERFDPDYAGTLDASDLPHNPAIEPGMSPADFRRLVALYDGEIRFTDENLGRILAALEARGRSNDTLVIVTADHGEEFFEHGGKGHQKSLFEEVVRIPLIVRWPGRLPVGSVVSDPVRLVDLVPTILSLAGVSERPSTQGRDVSKLLRGEPLPPADALLELLVDQNDIRALRTAGTKTIDWRHAGVAHLYDLFRDPREEQALGEGARLREALSNLDRALQQAAAFPGAARAESAEIGADLRARLGGLGYVGAEGASPRPLNK